MTCIEQFSYFEYFKTLCMVLVLMFVWCAIWIYLESRFFSNAKDDVFLDQPD